MLSLIITKNIFNGVCCLFIFLKLFGMYPVYGIIAISIIEIVYTAVCQIVAQVKTDAKR